jgi:single-strand DNA-binding protein
MSLLSTQGIGRLTADPEVKQVTINGEDVTIAEFSVAVDPEFGAKDTDFVRVVAWRKLAETAANHLSKGRLIYFEGRPKTRSYDNKDGQKVYIHEVVLNTFQFLDSAKGGNGAKEANTEAAPAKEAGKGNRRVPF